MVKRLLASVLSVCMLLGLMPVTAFAEETAAEPQECTHSYEALTTLPTCVEQGYTAYSCSLCGDSYEDDFVEPAGHSWDQGTVTSEATETAAGVMTYTCTVCSETREEEIPMLIPDVTPTPEETTEPTPTHIPSSEPTVSPEPVGVRVDFNCTPAEAVVVVCTTDDVEIEPEDDESYLILPGTYTYSVSCEGYVSLEKELVVEEGSETVTVDVMLEAIPEPSPEPVAVSAVSISAADDMILVICGETLQLTALVLPENASDKSVSWASSDENIATVDENGLVTGIAAGEVTITAAAKDGSGVCGSYNLIVDAPAAYAASGTCGDNLTWTLNSIGVLTISGTGAMYSYNHFSDVPWYAHKQGIEIVVVEDSVSSIGKYAFMDYKSLTSVTIGSGVTSIGFEAFEGCSNLAGVHISDLAAWCGIYFTLDASNPLSCGATLYLNGELVDNLVIPAGVTSIGSFAFYGCSALTSVTIPAGVTSVGEFAFYNCSALTSVTIPASVTSVGLSAFDCCSSLKKVYISDLTAWCGISFGDHGNPLGNGASLYLNGELVEDLVIPDGITSIAEWGFHGCSSLTSVTIPDGVTSIGEFAFYNCESLTGATISGSVTNIGDGAFSYCYNLTDVTIAYGVTSIGEDAFYGCRSLTSMTIPNSVTSIGSKAFYGCYNLVVEYDGTYACWKATGTDPVSIICSDGILRYEGTCGSNGGNNVCWYLDTEGNMTISGTGYMVSFFNQTVPWENHKNNIKTLTVEDGVTSISYSSFEDCSNLTSVTIPAGVTSIGGYAFYGCSSLTSVTIPAGVTSIGRSAFYGCSNLTAVYISDLTAWCGISFEDSSSNPMNNGAGLYLNGELVTELVVTQSLPAIGNYAFSGCTSLTGVDFKNNLTSIGSFAFSDCNSLTAVTLPDSVTEIANGVFYNCSALTSMTIPDGVASIGTSAFEGCSKLSSVTIPTGITSIGTSAFEGCSKLSSVTIPTGITSIGSYAFDGCSSDLILIYDASVLKWAKLEVKYMVNCSDYSGTVYKAGQYNYDRLWVLDSDGVLRIFGSGAMQDFYSYSAPWCSYGSSIKSVIIGNDVTGIGDSAFSGCSSLASVTIGDSVTSIGDHAFSGCSSLSSVTIPVSVKSISIGSDAFSRCSSELKFVYGGTLAQWMTLNLTGTVQCSDGTFIGYGSCGEQLTWKLSGDGILTVFGSGDIPDYSSYAPWGTGNIKAVVIEDGVTGIGGRAFYNCDGLTSVSIPASVTSIGSYAFYDCGKLSGVSIPASVTSIGSYAFHNCDGLTSISIPASVTSIGYYAFHNCDGLTSISIPNGVTSIGDCAFYDCGKLSSVTIPASVTNIGEKAFSNCSSSLVLVYDGTLAQWIKLGVSGEVQCSDRYGYTYGLCGSDVCWCLDTDGVLRIFGSGAMDDYDYSSSVPWKAYASDIKTVIIENGVTRIGSYAFYGCDMLSSVTVPVSVTGIGDKTVSNSGNLLYIYDGTLEQWKKQGFSGNVQCSDRSGYAYGNCGSDVYWCLDTNGVMTIYGSGAMTDFAGALSVAWRGYGDSIKTAIIESGVTSIGSYAFWEDDNLTAVTIPDSVKRIGDYAFYHCYRLTGVTIPGSVAKIGSYAFSQCSGLTAVSISEGVSAIGEKAFCDCDMLSSVTIPASVTNIGEKAFSDCYRLSSVTIPASVTNIGENAFSNCSSSLVLVYDGTLAQWIKLGVSGKVQCSDRSGYAYGNCGSDVYWCREKGALTIYGSGEMDDYTSISKAPWHSIESVVIEDGVTSIGDYAFGACSSLSEVIISDSVTSIGDYAFGACSSLSEVIISDSVTSIGDYAFRDCSSLTSVSLPTGITSIGTSAFEGCNEELTFTYGGTVVEWDELNIPYKVVCSDYSGTVSKAGTCGTDLTWVLDTDGVLRIFGSGAMDDYDYSSSVPWCSYGSRIKSVIIENGVTRIGSNAFRDCSSLTAVTIGRGVTSIGRYAFDNNYSILADVYISDLTAWCGISFGVHGNPLGNGASLYLNGELVEDLVIPDGITSIAEWGFYGCSSLTSVTIPDGVTSIGGHAFGGCSSLASVSIPDGVTSIGGHAFGGCSSLASVSIPDSVTGIGDGAFGGCSSLASVSIPDSVTGIGDSAFWSCSSLTSVTIPTGVERIGEGAFGACSSLTEVIISDSVTSIGTSAFCDCIGLTSVSIPNSVTSIGTSAFSGCSGLTSVSIPTGVTSIGTSAFEGCSGLTSVSIPNSVTSIGNKAFSRCTGMREICFAHDRTDSLSIGTLAFAVDYSWNINIDTTVCVPYADDINPAISGYYWPGSKRTVNYVGETRYLDKGSCGAGVSWTVDPEGVLTISGNGEMYVPTSYEYAPWSKYEVKNVIICSGVEACYAFPQDAGVKITVESGATLRTVSGSPVTLRGELVVEPGAKMINNSTIIIADEGLLVVKENASLISNGKISGKTEQAEVYGMVSGGGLPKAKALRISNDDNEPVTGSTLMVDMHLSYQLAAAVEPQLALQNVTWKSSSNAIATVDENGMVTFLKPGTVTITATAKDGSGKAASVKFTVLYNGFTASEKFSAALAAESTGYGQKTSIGLQLGDSAKLNVFGNNKSLALDNGLFEYVSSNPEYVSVDEYGVVTAEKAGVSAVITVSLAGDPLKRTAKITVKTIPVQTGTVDILPAEDRSEFCSVDANGDLCADSGLEAASYALYVDKIAKGQPAQTYQIRVSAQGADGSEMESVKGKFTWTTSNSGIATVKENADGTVYITVKPNVDGACTITATSKDTSKAAGYIAVYVMDKSPRLGAASLVLDSQKLNSAEVSLVASYKNAITAVSFYDASYNSTGKLYAEQSGRLAVSYDEQNECVIFTANSYLKNQTIKGQLLVQTENGDYRLNISVVIKNTVPSVSIKQKAKFNLFYLDSTAELGITVKNEEIENVELVSEDFAGVWDGEKLTVTYATGTPPAKPNTKLSLKIYLSGYEYPVEKQLTLSSVTTKPSLSLKPASGAMDMLMIVHYVTTQVYNNTAKSYLELGTLESLRAYNSYMDIPATWRDLPDDEVDEIELCAEAQMLSTLKSGKVNIELKDKNWLSPITLVYNLTVNAKAPTVKLSSGTLSLNSLYPSTVVSVPFTINSSSDIEGRIADTVLAPTAPGTEADKLYVWVSDGAVHAQIKDNTVKNGSYTFRFAPQYSDDKGVNLTLSNVTLTVKVVNTLPTAKLEKTSVTLNNLFSAQTATVRIIPTGTIMGDYYIQSVTPTAKEGTAARVEADKIGFAISGDSAELSFAKESEPKAGTYSYNVVVVCNNGTDEAVLKTMVLTVKVINTLPTAKLEKTSLTLNNLFSAQTVTARIIPTGTTMGDYYIQSVTPTAKEGTAARIEADKIGFAISGDSAELSFAKGSEPKAGTYSYNVVVVCNNGTDEVVLKTMVLSVKVINTLPTAKLEKTSLTLNNLFSAQTATARIIPTGTIMGDYYIQSVTPTAKEGTAARIEADKIGFAISGDSAELSFAKGSEPKAGTYSYNVVVVCNNGTDEVVLKTMVLTVKVINTQPKVSLSATVLNLNTDSRLAGKEEASIQLRCSTKGYTVDSYIIERSDVGAALVQSEKLRVSYTGADTVSIALAADDIPKVGSYKFRIIPVVADGVSGETAALNALSFTVKVYSNAKFSAAVSASGKLDAVQRADSGISYTLTKLNYVVGNVVSAELVGQDASLFELEELAPNAKGQFMVRLKLKDEAQVSTSASYKVQLRYTLDTGITVDTAVLTVKVTNTAIKLSAVPTTQSIYQSQSRMRTVKYTVKLTSPVNAEIGKVSFGSVGILQRSLVNENTNIWVVISPDGSYADVYVRIKDTSALAAGKTYTLPLLIEAQGKADNLAATKINISLKVFK